MLHQGGLAALTLALLVVLQACQGERLRLAVIPDPREQIVNPFAHGLPAYAAGLRKLGHNVTLLDKVEDNAKLLEGLLGSSNRTQDAYFDAVLTQGKTDQLFCFACVHACMRQAADAAVTESRIQ